MVPRKLRLSRGSFPGNRTGNRLSSPSFSVAYGPSPSGGCAVVVSKAIARQSPARHLIKRRTLSVLRPFCRTNQYLVVYAKAGAATLTFRALSEELTSLLSRLGR